MLSNDGGHTLSVYSIDGQTSYIGTQITNYNANDVAEGYLTLYSDGHFKYVPVAGFVGTDSMTVYIITDGVNTSTTDACLQFVVSDAPLSATGVNVSASATIASGSVSVADFTDPGGGRVGEYSAGINWGDGSSATGGSVSPLLIPVVPARCYVFDLWADQWRQTAQGDVIIVRYADDFVVGFQHESDAKRFLEELRERFRKFNLELHADKTRVIEFGRFASERRERRGQGKPETFNFLGFTHVCDKTRTGSFVVLRRTMAARVRAKLAALKQKLQKCMHHVVGEVGGRLASVLRGHFQYYGVPRNSRMIGRFRDAVRHLWQRALSRRSQKGYVTESRISLLASRFLPTPHICHPYPLVRLAVMIQGKSPVR